MIILVGYLSVEGQTRKIATTIAEQIEARGHRAILFDISTNAEYTLERPEAAILCAPVHGGKYPDAFFIFARRERDWLNTVPSAFVSVSLMIASDFEDEKAEARGFTIQFATATGWTPGEIVHVAGALRFGEYDFFKRWIVRRIANRVLPEGPKEGQSVYEFTDWATLSGGVDMWLQKAAAFEP